ncbi:MAG: STAS domain-containing protein [Roseibacillus sp.]
MIDNDTLDVGETDGYVWVRIKGKGSFLTSPSLKGFVERRMESGETRFVIDLGECPAMDSTFMGTLAGIAMRLSRSSGGRLQLNGVCDRNRQSLEDLGLDALIDIDPSETEWRAHVEDVRGSLEPLPEESDASDAAHVLEAHRQLCEASEENVKKFATALEVLERRAVGE